ncbi:unnamed protein product [Spirodela intermedia]|uniref:Uncharacterized protein n=1 Tax=Spirodela intermedia TaxID=51605 RepID=A0A7I8LDX8_SPIIN|nr:unnamed protein product [Spirodela intermedia]
MASPRSPSPMTRSRHRRSSAASGRPPALGSARTPAPHAVSAKRTFADWSLHCGRPTMGTPQARLSSVEFHPQCVTKQPTAR